MENNLKDKKEKIKKIQLEKNSMMDNEGGIRKR